MDLFFLPAIIMISFVFVRFDFRLLVNAQCSFLQLSSSCLNITCWCDKIRIVCEVNLALMGLRLREYIELRVRLYTAGEV